MQLSDPASPTPTFTAPQLEGGFGLQVLTFKLTVSSGDQSSTDTVNITVKNVNHAPEAHSGADQLVREDSLVTLDGSDSFDLDGDQIQTYHWVQTGGTAVTLSDASAATPTFVAPFLPGGVSGTEVLMFALTVSDGELSSINTNNTVMVTVEQVNHPPVAHAGTNQTRNEGSLVALDGTQSIDPDGDPIVSYAWSQIEGPPVALSDAASATPTFTAPATGPGRATLEFGLVVSDGQLNSAQATVKITVQNINDPPRCDLARASVPVLWPPDHKLISVGIVGVTDPNNDGVVLTVTGVTQDEPVNGLGDGDTSPDAVLQGAQVLLRAERSGTGNGRVYRVGFTADDGLTIGGQCTGSVSVCVPHDRKTSTCADDGQQFDSLNP